ncbi:diguanylate cyclase domain-containing protein [Bacillus sp. CGMCC 1.60114]|uniref:sensor domain-containing protein n=1 Tax=unclassified Bacillus (in: firmicutes) TaxID=185979 RepID=UPI003627B183
MTKNKQTHLFFLLGLLFIYTVFHYIALQIWGEHSFLFQMETSITTLIIDLVICSSLFYSTSRKKGHAYTFWMLLAIGSLFYFIGDTIVMYQRLVLHEYRKFVDPSDIFYLLFLLFYTLAFFYKFMHDCENWKRIFILCDICIIITTIFTLNYYLFIKNAVNQTEISIISEFVQLAYPVANLLFLLIGVCLLFQLVSITSKLVISLLSCSLILYALVDSTYAYIKYFLPHGSTFTVAPLYQVILGIVAIACLLHTNEQNKYVQVLFTIQMGEKIRLSIPYLSVAALIIFTLYENTFSPILVKGVFLTFFFVLIRHMLVRNQNKKLLQKQQQFNLELEKQIKLRTEDLVNQTNALFQSQQMFKSLYEHHPDPIFTLDLHGNFLNINNAGITLLGYQADEILNKPYYSLVYEEDLETIVDVFRYVKKGHSTALDIRAYHQNRDIYYLHVTVVPIIFKEQIMGIYVMVKDITESKKQQEQINFLAYHDALTHLANRRAFEEQLDNAIIQAGKDETQFAIMFLDLDRFKIINDTLGHKMGDLLLIEVAKRLQRAVGQGGKVARLAGDEFTVLIEKYDSFSKVETIANEILKVMNEPIQIENHTLHITPSIGIATYPDAGDDAISLLQHADMAMYEAKNKGKNGISIYQ